MMGRSRLTAKIKARESLWRERSIAKNSKAIAITLKMYCLGTGKKSAVTDKSIR